jgi:arginase
VPSTLRLLLPEWQGYGLNADVSRGATALAAALFGDREFVTIDAPDREDLRVVDGVLGLHSIAPRFDRAIGVIRRAAPERIVTVGGTCGVELAPISYLNARYAGDLAVVWIDAHADLNTPATSPSGHFHGMVLRTLLGDGPEACTRGIARALTPAQVVLVGVREFDPPEAEYVSRHAIPVIGDAVFRDPTRIIDLIRAGGRRRLYVHFDVDVLDPAAFPASLMHAPGGGPALGEAAGLVRVLAAEFDVAGLSVLEFCERDPAWTRAVAQALAPRAM